MLAKLSCERCSAALNARVFRSIKPGLLQTLILRALSSIQARHHVVVVELPVWIARTGVSVARKSDRVYTLLWSEFFRQAVATLIGVRPLRTLRHPRIRLPIGYRPGR